MPSIGEALYLLFLRYRVKLYEWLQERQVRKMFYADVHFRNVDRAIRSSTNPYCIPQAFPYGETPILTLKAIADRCGLTAEDNVVELGCGRGRGVFFLRHYKGCQVRGVEWVPTFVEHAQNVAREFNIQGVSFECNNMCQTDLKDATFVYLYGTCLHDFSIKQLKLRFKQLPPQAKVVTVSYPIEGLYLKDQFTLSFPWGKGEVFLQIDLLRN